MFTIIFVLVHIRINRQEHVNGLHAGAQALRLVRRNGAAASAGHDGAKLHPQTGGRRHLHPPLQEGPVERSPCIQTPRGFGSPL